VPDEENGAAPETPMMTAAHRWHAQQHVWFASWWLDLLTYFPRDEAARRYARFAEQTKWQRQFLN
jgi:hypothetical protein